VKSIQPISTQRLVLRPLAAADATQTYAGWMNDPAVNRYLESRYAPLGIADLVQFIDACNRDAATHLFGIFLRAGDAHIGNIKLGPVNARHRLGDIGLVIGEASCWGKGYAREAIAALTGLAHGVLNVNKVTASCYGSNVGSKRAFLAAGFVVEGVRPAHFWSDDHWEDCVLMAHTLST
jgi:[ribosomal protein S5]-alanine N-acetyltransferase